MRVSLAAFYWSLVVLFCGFLLLSMFDLRGALVALLAHPAITFASIYILSPRPAIAEAKLS